MSHGPLVPAALDWDTRGVPYSAQYQDIYHPAVGALAQAQHVFLAGCELPQRWQGRDRFVLLETGFGLGNNFLATWAAWRLDPQRCTRLQFISVERHPLRRADLASVPRDASLELLAGALTAAWPVLTPNLHVLPFDAGRVELLLALGDVQHWLPQLHARVDAFYLDGFAPTANPQMWDRRVCKALGRLARPQARLATWSASRSLREDLGAAGFQVRRAAGIGGKRDITLATYDPPFTPRTALTRRGPRGDAEPRALIVGAGLAGCATAWALAEHGWHSTVLEREADVARQGSGNPAGLFHGIVNAQDGVHARFNRAAALAAHAAVRAAQVEHGVAAGLDGLLRLETVQTLPQMAATLQRLGLPGDYVQALDRIDASARAGIALPAPAWWYPGGGWVDPAGLARSWLARAGARTTLRTGVEVARLERDGLRWRALDPLGACIAHADHVVLANAADALRLLGAPDWPIEPVRGQLSLADAHHLEFTLPRVAVAGSGYLLPQVGALCVFGATSQRDDADPSVRWDDHRRNLDLLAALIGRSPGLELQALRGRTGWRCTSRDRLPMVGAVPDLDQDRGLGRWDLPRGVPRLPGLFVLSALGSRGITWSALCAQVLAAWITGAAVPLESELLDAIDPARYVARQQRRAAAA